VKNDNTTQVLGWCLCHHPDRIARTLAGLVLAELPVTAAEHPKDPVTDLVSRGAVEICRAYAINSADHAVPIIGHAIDHLTSYFPGLEPPAAAPLRSMPPGCDRAKAWTASWIDQLGPEVRVTLLRRISQDYVPIDADARGDVEHELARHGRLYGTIHGGVYRALCGFGGIDDAGNRVDPEAWKTANVSDLAKDIIVNVRANLGPVLSDVIVREALAFADRHGS
jgi:hypothetical protein